MGSGMRRNRKLLLECGSPIIEGSGEMLTFKINGWRKTKTGTHEQYELELRGCRHTVKLLAEQIAAMQVRDRQRLDNEINRLKREIAPLVAT